MLRSRVRRSRSVSGPRLAGVRTAWRTLDDGEFFCSGCGGDRSYRLRTGRRRFTVLGVPLVPRGEVAPVVECAACRRRHDPAVLERLTTHRLAGMLRDAVHTVAVAMLEAGGSGSAATRRAAVAAVHAAGYPECTEEGVLARLVGLHTGPLHHVRADDPAQDPGAGLSAAHQEVCEALEPLGPHLERPGREALLLEGAAIALADGPYEAAEREMLDAVGNALALHPEETERLLAAARTPS
ncbi:TerB family tellurite resistance protein [Streptomyces sp. TR06-5]|uniref:TerB family tellurite resistance protein n=1 Tax=unclassified Streptomyces TaxID=2593676 RepID=UPI0039A15661